MPWDTYLGDLRGLMISSEEITHLADIVAEPFDSVTAKDEPDLERSKPAT